MRIDPGCGPMVTFLQFVAVTLFSISSQIQKKSSFPFLGFKKRNVPMLVYIVMVIFFASSSVINNLAFAYHISVPLNTIFRSSSMVCNVIISFLVFRKKYSFMQIISVLLVTIGVTVVTLKESEEKVELVDLHNTQMTGILLLFCGLLISSALGVVQEWSRDKYGGNSAENQFYYVSFKFLVLENYN